MIRIIIKNTFLKKQSGHCMILCTCVAPYILRIIYEARSLAAIYVRQMTRCGYVALDE